MIGEEGKGFARRVTKSNLGSFASLLRDRTKESEPGTRRGAGSSGTSTTSSSDDQTTAQALFAGSKVVVRLPFTFPTGSSGQRPGSNAPVTAVSSGQTGDVAHYALTVLVAEIPGPGRWTQVSFSKEVFTEFFGAQSIDITHMNSNGTVTYEPRVNPIVKKSHNYCYELGAAAGLAYPTIGRPISVFVRLEVQRFRYRLVMPSDPNHATLDTFLATRWAGSARHMRRVITDLSTLLSAWPAAPFSLTTSVSQGGLAN